MANYEKLFMKAVEHQVAGEMPAAERLYRKILKHLPRNVATSMMCGQPIAQLF